MALKTQSNTLELSQHICLTVFLLGVLGCRCRAESWGGDTS